MTDRPTLAQRLRAYTGDMSMPDTYADGIQEAADEIERLTREIAELKADRDSWIEQASQRAQETVEAMQQVEAYRLRPVAWRFRFPTGGRWHYTEHGPNTHSKPELTWEPLYGHAALSAPREPLSVRADAFAEQVFATLQPGQAPE